tara:strand:+ start:118 stop:396 length:279 start_codon:yes stop_codon:yes gene_type:complete
VHPKLEEVFLLLLVLPRRSQARLRLLLLLLFVLRFLLVRVPYPMFVLLVVLVLFVVLHASDPVQLRFPDVLLHVHLALLFLMACTMQTSPFK